MARYAIDIETDGFLDVLTVVHSLVIQDLDTGMAHSFCDQPGYASIDTGLRFLRCAELIVAHNAIRFDIPAIRKVYPDWWTDATVRDTLLLSRLQFPDMYPADRRRVDEGTLPANLAGRHSLKAWGHRLGQHKGEYEGGFDAWSKDLQDYCEVDVAVLVSLWNLLQEKPYAEAAVTLEHDFAEIMHLQQTAGFPFDQPAATKLYGRLLQRRLELEEKMEEVFPPRVVEMKSTWWVTPFTLKEYPSKKDAVEDGAPAHVVRRGRNKTKEIPFNSGSRDEIARRLTEKYGWKPSQFTPDGKPKMDEEVLDGLEFPEAKVLSEYFMLTKRIGAVSEGNQSWLKAATGTPPRVHGSVNTVGAVTRRCTHSHPNMTQVPSSAKPYGAECRALFTALPGYKLVGVDASGIELRCLGHYLARYDGGSYARTVVDGDIHTVHQKAAGLATRAEAKVFGYAYLYGAGAAKLGAIVKKSARVAGKMKSELERNIPVLKKLKADLEKVVDARGFIKAIDGGALVVRSKHSVLNTLLQSAGGIAMKMATVVFYEEANLKGWEWGVDYWVAAHIHDEMQIIAKEGIANEVGKLAVWAIQEAGTRLNFQCPLDGGFSVGNNWAETH